MTVRELINWLEEYDDDTEVMIGKYQKHGSDFAYTCDEIDNKVFEGFYGELDKVLFLLEGSHVGIMSDMEDDEYEYRVDNYKEIYEVN